MADKNPFADPNFGSADGGNPFADPTFGMPKSTASRVVSDLAKSFKQGAQEIPGQLAGLADVVPALAFNARPFTTAANAIGEATGFQPGKWAKETQAQLSPEARASQQEIDKVWDDPNSTPLEVAGAYVANPAYSANQVMRSVPGMLAGGLGSRALMKAGAVAETATAAAVPGHLERLVGQKMAAPIAGGIGEGALQTGQQMVEGEDNPDQRKNAIAALASGAIDAAIGAGSGRVANAMGLETPETLMAGGKRAAAPQLSPFRRVAGGAISEGVLQELPQSMQEQVWQNWAAGKPLGEGVIRQGVEGTIAGGILGVGSNVVPQGQQPTATPPVIPPAADAPPPAPGPIDFTDPGPIGITTSLGAQPPAPGSQIPAVPGLPDYPSTLQEFDPARRVPVGPITSALMAMPGMAPPAPGTALAPLASPGAMAGMPYGTGPISRAAGFVPMQQPAIEGPRALPNEGPQDITDNGQPFRSGLQAARAAKQAGLGFRPVPVDGGYVVRRDTSDAEDVTPRMAAPAPTATPLLESPVDVAAHAAATSPLNGRPEPTDPQKNAENYRMGRAKVGTFHVSIENPQGSVRRGKDEDGKAWETTMTAHYGRLPGTKAADWTPEKPQQIDAFVKPGTRADHAGPVFVIDQVNPKTGRFDEHKVIFGASNEAEAEAIYRSNYTPGWQGLGSITRLDDRAFKEWAYDGTQKREPIGRLDRWQSARPVPGTAPDRQPAVQRPSAGPVAQAGQPTAAPASQPPAAVAPASSSENATAARGLLAEYTAAVKNGVGDKGIAVIRRRAEKLAARTPATDEAAVLALDMLATRMGIERKGVPTGFQLAEAPAPELGEKANRPVSSRQPAPVLESEQLGEKKSPNTSNAEPGRYGRDGQDLAEGGRPFKTKDGAQAFRKKHRPQSRVVKVDGGYALRDKTDAEIKNDEAAGKRRMSAARAASYEKNPFLTFLAKHGLYHEKDKPRSQKVEFSPDRQISVPGYSIALFRRDGKMPDALLQPAIEEGYLPQGADENQLEDLIRKAVSGQRVAPLYAEGAVEQEMERRIEAQQEEEPDWLGPLDDADLEAVDFDQADEALQAEVRELMTALEAQGVDYESVLEDVARKTQNGTQNEYLQAAKQALQSLQAAQGVQPGGEGAGGPVAGARGNEAPAAAASAAEEVDPKTAATAALIEEARRFKYRNGTIERLLDRDTDPADGFTQHLFEVAMPRARAYDRIMRESNGDPSGIEFKYEGTGRDRYAVVLPDASQAGKWRISYFDERGFSSHHVENTRDAAVESMVADGFTIESKGTLDELTATREWKLGTDYADIIDQLNRKIITHDEFIRLQAKLNEDYERDKNGAPKAEAVAQAPDLSAPTQQDVLAQQERRENADALDERARIDREAAAQTLTAQTAPEQRKDTTGDIFGGPTVEDAMAEKARRDAKAGKPPAGPDLLSAADPAPAEPTAATAPSADTLRALADLNNALADLGDLLGRPFRANIAPEQEAKLVPILTRVLDAAFRLGYYKFKDAARFALDTIREKIGADVADALTLEHLQGAYIAMSGQYRDKGADKAREIEDALKRAERKLKEATSAAAAAAPAPAEKPASKIEDFGQKLEGARKDYAATLKDAEAVDIAAEPLSKSWPEPDYDKLLAGGADPYVVAFIHAARDEVPTKPQKGWKLKGWVDSVETLRGAAKGLLDGSITREQLTSRLTLRAFDNVRSNVGSRAELYELVGHAKSLKGVTFAQHHYNLYKGQENVTKWVVEQKAKATVFGNWPRELAVADTKAEMLEQFKAKMAAESLDGDKAKAAKGQFIIYRKRNQEGAFIGKKIGREYIDLKKLPDVAAARAYLESNTADLSAALERYKDTPFERNAENRPRVGDDHRNGAAVTPEVFADTFGFRGVQFGNYVEQDRRQSDLNQTFDALMDMAAVLGVPPRALSLNGRLGLAFGARGKGGKNAPAAHYEPDTVVINLTKGNGPGSLGHEWWHAVDNYFGKEFGEGGFATDGARVDRLRAEMQAAFKAVRNATQVPTLRKRAAELDKRRTKPYWNTPLELSARAFESYLIAKLNDQGAANDYLANVVDEKVWNLSEEARATFFGGQAVETYPYPGQAELPGVRAAFDEFFKVVETREDDAGNVAMFSRATSASGQTLTAQDIEAAVSRLTRDWLRRPDIHVLESMDEAPEAVRRVWQRQNSQGGTGDVEGFHYRGGVYLVASALESEADVRRVLFHEALGHFGLRNVFGDELKSILQEIASMRGVLVARKAKQYGLDMKNEAERLMAAEEVLAELAQTRPELGWVQRTISAIRRWLRAHGVSLGLSDNDIIADYILPARGWVERGRSAAPSIMRGPAMAARSNAGRDPFYSALAAEVDKIGAKAMPGMGWQSALNGLVNKGAVKADEVEWSGIRDWLGLQQGKVTKQQVLDYLGANGVQVKEVTLGTSDTSGERETLKRYGLTVEVNPEDPGVVGFFNSDMDIMSAEDVRMEFGEEAGAAARRIEGLMLGNESNPKYATYQLPGGQSYREVLLTLPKREPGPQKFQIERIRETPSGGVQLRVTMDGKSATVSRTAEGFPFRVDYEKGESDRGGKTEDEAIEVARAGLAQRALRDAPTYRSSHWSEPNVLAHIRLNDRTDADGKRVLFVEELQSDFAQDARKQGIKTGKEAPNFSTFAERRGMPQSEWQRIWDSQDKLTGKDADLWAEWQAELKRGANGVPAAPFIDSTDKWLTLALKRIMVMAAQEGYDKVAFVNGEQSADRYDLSKQVDAIDWIRRKDGTYDIAAFPVGGGQAINRDRLSTGEVADMIGKELAERLTKEDGQPLPLEWADATGTLRGLDLKVGGEGMVAFYDKIVPAAVNKLLAKVGGGKLEAVDLGSTKLGGRYAVIGPNGPIAGNVSYEEASEEIQRRGSGYTMREREAANNVALQQPGFTITPAMREKLAGGMPMFARQGDQTDTPAFRAWFKGSKVVDDQGKPLVVYHGTPAGDIDVFKVSKSGSFGGGIYTTPDAWAASIYANEPVPTGRQAAPTVYPVYVSIQNPAPVSEAVNVGNWRGEQAVRDTLMERGYDGVIDWRSGEIVAFRPEQIKSAIGNRGTFDPGNPDIMFSRAARSETINSAVDHLNALVRETPGKLSWWHKTVGTMQNLALRSPQFKRVYDGVQNFINDVSLYATEAADLAPTILPKLETWSDLTKSPLSAEDTKALQAPVFEGTLKWTRGEDGQPVEEPDPQQAGIVWTPEELRDRFQLTGERQANGKWSGQIGLYLEARDALDKSLTNLAVSDMLRFAGRDAQPIAKTVMESANVGEAAETLSQYLRSLADADPARASVLNDTADKVDAKAARAQDLIRRGYAPLSRFGTYTLEATLPTGERYFGMFETQAERTKMLRTLNVARAGEISQGTLSQEAFKIFAGVSPETLELFGDLLGLESQGDGPGAKAFQEYLKATKSNRSAMKRLIERKGIAGFSEDVGRVLAGFIYSNARQTSTNLHTGEITQSLTAMKDGDKTQGELLDSAVKLVEYIRNPKEEAQALRGLLFAQYIGGSVASALVNMTQPLTMTLPWLSQYGGLAKAGKQLAAAARDAGKGATGDARLDAALRKAEEEGIVSPQEVHQLLAQASGRGSLRAGDGTMLGDASAKAGNALSKVALAWGKGFSLAEQFNRRVTFIAAWRNAAERGLSDPSSFAEQAVAETQGVYNKGNKPAWARGAVGSTVFTFKQYSIAYVEMLHRMATRGGPEGKRAALYALAILFLLSGVGGGPGADDLDDLISGALQALGYNFDSKAKRREFLTELIGQAGADFVERGVSGIAGVPIDVSGRLGMGNLIPGTGLLTKKTDHTRDVAEIAGPAGDLANRAFQAGGSLVRGDIAGAVHSLSPSAIRNVAQAYDMATMGMYRDRMGKKVIDTDGYDAFAKAVGFQPNDVKRVQDAAIEVQRRVALNKMRETEIADAWAQGVFEKDQDKVKAARDALAQWNADNAESPIRINFMQIAKRVRAMNEDKATRIAKTAPVEIRAAVRRELESAR